MTELKSFDSYMDSGDIASKIEVRYDLSPEELNKLEKDLVDSVEEQFTEEGVYAAWIRPHHRYANIIRAYEANFFPEVESVSENEEDQTLFLALVDTRNSVKRVVHGATISGINLHNSDEEQSIKAPGLNGDHTGFIVIDDLIEIGNFTVQEFYDYYAQRGINVEKCISVETNFRVGEKTEPFHGLRTAQLAYKVIFDAFKNRNPEMDRAAVFASINRPSILSFKRVGLQYEYLMGRDNLKTPEEEFGQDYLPVIIPYNKQNVAVFDAMGEQPQELTF